MSKETIVISVGGSLIVPNEIDTGFLKNFKRVIENHIKKGQKFVIITGGGKTARRYQTAANAVSKLENEDLDWIGIHSTRLNGHLLRSIFRKYANPRLAKDPTRSYASFPVIVSAGWKPGWSTDYVAVRFAKKLGARRMVNLSDIDTVYDKDPKKFKNAKPIIETTWKKFRNIIPKKWGPGIHTPFDPIAAKEAEKLKLEVAMINGNHLHRFEAYLDSKPFKGTIIA
jgi:uridylate kinase